MGYVALYREWRPQTFSDIIGQEHISRTLQNAIKTNRIAHAYLFCGPRGTGKTTTAKVLAKTLNCVNGSGSEPCNQCESCLRVTEGTSMDVMEIDAASNRGIDEIRDLREKVKFAPTEGRYRIYIIDEVHMLTTEAFNALLKTLEEPPSHVIFVLATTEPHKIPLTILSRCQRFDFRRIGLNDIVTRLMTVAADLGINVEEEALTVIAKAAEGGMRDALSVLDQCISFGGDKVSLEDVNDVLGTVDSELLFRMADFCRSFDVSNGLRMVNELVGLGKDLRVFIRDLTEYFRNLLLIEVCNDVNELVLVSADSLERMKNLTASLGKSRILALIDNFSAAEREIKWTSQPRLVLELAVIKASQSAAVPEYDDLLNRVAKLEEMFKNSQIPIVKSPVKVVSREIAEPAAASGVPEVAVTINKPEQFVDTETVKKCWQEILERIKKVRISARAFLIEGEPVEIEGDNLVLSFPSDYSFHKEKVEQAENRSAIEQVIKEVTGVKLKLKCKFETELSGGGKQNLNNAREENSLVDRARSIFGGDVIEIKD